MGREAINTSQWRQRDSVTFPLIADSAPDSLLLIIIKQVLWHIISLIAWNSAKNIQKNSRIVVSGLVLPLLKSFRCWWSCSRF